MIMPENITNETVLKSNGKWFTREEEEEKLSECYYVTHSFLVIDYDGIITSEANENSFEN